MLARLEGDLDAMCLETLAEMHRQWPEFAERIPADVLATMVRATHQRATALLATGQESPGLRAQAIDFARQANRVGITTDTVLAAYRVGASRANARVRAVLVESAVDVAGVLAMWEWSARFFDDLAARTSEGVQRESVAQHARRARARQALLDALLDGRSTEDLPAEALWQVPQEIVVVVGRGTQLDAPERDVIVGRRSGTLIAIADAESPWLQTPGSEVIVGPRVPAGAASTSLEPALRLAQLLGRADTQGSVEWVEQHLLDLAVAGDRWAAVTLVARSLAPLRAEPIRSQAMLRETLSAWLATPARPHAIAHALSLHPQSVQYRLRRLRAVLGDKIDDPEERFALTLALRLERHSAPHSDG
ncbi:MAG: helix-turn-helix domain-containing protein [Patulibacter sp.]|nr:helix-turn-helix domain-containing protein [Patulibacter sp.]